MQINKETCFKKNDKTWGIFFSWKCVNVLFRFTQVILIFFPTVYKNRVLTVHWIICGDAYTKFHNVFTFLVFSVIFGFSDSAQKWSCKGHKYCLKTKDSIFLCGHFKLMHAEVPCSSTNMHCEAFNKLLKKNPKQQTPKLALVNEHVLKGCSSHPYVCIEEDNWNYCIYCYIFAKIELFI